jgi:tetratricopeptide (TPR) repeat protein
VYRAYVESLLAAAQYPRLMAETDKLIAAQKDPSDVPSWIYTDRAVVLHRLDKRTESLAEFEKAMNTKDARENNDAAAVIIDKLSEEVGVDEALTSIASRVQEGKPGSERLQIAQAILYHRKHDDEQAVATVEKLLGQVDKMSPVDRARTLQFAGTLFITIPKPQPQKAIDALKLALKNNPNDANALNNLASLYVDYVTPPDANAALPYSQRAYDNMVKTGVTSPELLDTHGRVLTMLPNRVEEGIVLLQSAADHTSIPDPHLHLAQAYVQKGATQQAQKQLAQAQAAVDRQRREKQAVDEIVAAQIVKLTEQVKKMADSSKTQAGTQ